MIQRLVFRAQKQLSVYHSSLLFTLTEHVKSAYELDHAEMFEGGLFLSLHAVQNHVKSIKRCKKQKHSGLKTWTYDSYKMFLFLVKICCFKNLLQIYNCTQSHQWGKKIRNKVFNGEKVLEPQPVYQTFMFRIRSTGPKQVTTLKMQSRLSVQYCIKLNNGFVSVRACSVLDQAP